MPIHLFTQYYRPQDVNRRAEIDECLQRNIQNPSITHVHVLLEQEADRVHLPPSPKLNVRIQSDRITYGRWLALTNDLAAGSISVLANSDIYLDASIEVLNEHADALRSDRSFLALTRYNREQSSLVLNQNPHWCQDTWAVVRGTEPFHRALLQEANFEIGHPGCDNKIAYVMHSYGFKVSNPCLAWRSVHLHADAGRPYDSRGDKLIGLHAFVHPTRGVTDASRLDVELLSRSREDLTEINVNHWINRRKSYLLAGVSVNSDHQTIVRSALSAAELAAAGHPEPEIVVAGTIESAVHADRPQPAVLPQVTLGYVRRSDVVIDDLTLVEVFDRRFSLYRDAEFYYYSDSGWPSLARVLISDLPAGFLAFPAVEKFGLGFSGPVLDLYPAVIASEPRHVQDLMFWQHPCRTEQAAWERACASNVHDVKASDYAIYIGLPWATFIDKGQIHEVTLRLVTSRLKQVRAYLQLHGVGLRVHTVCQHIFWRQHLQRFHDLGITDLWISHKELGLDGDGSMQFHAWPLFAVNYRDPGRQDGLEIKPIRERQTQASFIGAHMEHYLSDVRLKLQGLSSLPGYDIQVNDSWHFNKAVYEEQIQGKVIDASANRSAAVTSYNRKLSDSVFSLCPVGAGPNTLRLWESMAVGAIPVCLSDRFEFPDLDVFAPGTGLTWDDAVIRHSEAEIETLAARLSAIPTSRLEQMQRNGRLLQMLCERFTPVGAPFSPALMPLAVLDLFKHQQLHLGGKTAAVFDGNASLSRASVQLTAPQSSLLLHFDKTELVVGLQVEVVRGRADGIEIDIGVSPGYSKVVPVVHAATLSSSHDTFWFDTTQVCWGIALKFDIRFAGFVESAPVKLVFHPIVSSELFARQMRALDEQGVLFAASQTNEQRKDDLFDTAHIESGAIVARLQAFARTQTFEPGRRLFAERPPVTHNLAGEAVTDGVTMYVHLMNRNENVAKNIRNWLGQRIDELILLDWSSEPPVAAIPGVLDDPRVRVVRVDGQTSFIRSWAQNLATRMARHNRIFKCDSDVTFAGDFFADHPLQKGEFWVGDWHQARDHNERHLHGETYYHIDDFERVNGYDERIISYGHDDTNLKDRMVLSGLRRMVFSYNQLHHQPHNNAVRVTNQTMTHPMVNTRYHRLFTNQVSLWSPFEQQLVYVYSVIRNDDRVVLEVEVSQAPAVNCQLHDRAVDAVASWYCRAEELRLMNKSQKVSLIWLRSTE